MHCSDRVKATDFMADQHLNLDNAKIVYLMVCKKDIAYFRL